MTEQHLNLGDLVILKNNQNVTYILIEIHETHVVGLMSDGVTEKKLPIMAIEKYNPLSQFGF